MSVGEKDNERVIFLFFCFFFAVLFGSFCFAATTDPQDQAVLVAFWNILMSTGVSVGTPELQLGFF